MKIYSKIVIDMETMEVVASECFDYHGPISHCGGGKGGGGAEPDYEYNKRMASIAEDNQDMAREMFNLYKYGVTYDPNQSITLDDGTTTTMGAQKGFDESAFTSEMELMQNMLRSQDELLPSETELKRTQYEEGTKLVKGRSEVMQDLYKEAVAGIDVDKRISENRAGVEHAFAGQQDITNRNLSRMGIDPSSGRGLAMAGDVGIQKAKALAGTEAGIRREAEDENFSRLQIAAGMPV
ncbi:MAG: hypothetical protein ACYS32_00615 [Planctomycetota bacterium]